MKYSKTIFEALTTNSPIGIVILDMEGRVTACNPAFEKLFGYSLQEILGNLLDPYISSTENYYENMSYTKRILTHGETIRMTGKRQKKDRSQIFVEIQGLPLFEHNSQVGLLTLYHDITDLSHAKEAMRDIYSSFIHIMDSIDASVYVADMKSYEIIFMNQYMRQMFGGDFIGTQCWQVFRNEGHPCSICTNQRLLDSNGNPVGEVVWEGQNPITHRWFKNFDRAIAWGDGRYVRLEVATDITDMKEAEAKLIHQVNHDPLTSLPNRLFFINELSEILRKQANQKDFVVLFLDIDNFKSINDNYGHAVGDKLLIESSARMKDCLRDGDFVARVSGDEFTFILGGLSKPEYAVDIVKRIIAHVTSPYSIDEQEISFSVSVGISIPENGSTPDDLLRQSDEAMYQVKRSGKNGYAFFHQDFNTGIEEMDI